MPLLSDADIGLAPAAPQRRLLSDEEIMGGDAPAPLRIRGLKTMPTITLDQAQRRTPSNDVVITAIVYFLADMLARTSPDAEALQHNVSLAVQQVAATARSKFDAAS